MNRLLLIALVVALSLGALAQEARWSVGGLVPGLEAGRVDWLKVPCPDGQHKHGKLTVEVKSGRLVAIWGPTLEVDGKIKVKADVPISAVESSLGRPDRVLYGDGSKGGQQVLFYDKHGLMVMATNNIVKQVRLQPKP